MKKSRQKVFWGFYILFNDLKVLYFAVEKKVVFIDLQYLFFYFFQQVKNRMLVLNVGKNSAQPLTSRLTWDYIQVQSPTNVTNARPVLPNLSTLNFTTDFTTTRDRSPALDVANPTSVPRVCGLTGRLDWHASPVLQILRSMPRGQQLKQEWWEVLEVMVSPIFKSYASKAKTITWVVTL